MTLYFFFVEYFGSFMLWSCFACMFGLSIGTFFFLQYYREHLAVWFWSCPFSSVVFFLFSEYPSAPSCLFSSCPNLHSVPALQFEFAFFFGRTLRDVAEYPMKTEDLYEYQCCVIRCLLCNESDVFTSAYSNFVQSAAYHALLTQPNTKPLIAHVKPSTPSIHDP